MRRPARRNERGATLLGVVVGLALLVMVAIAGVKIIPLYIHGGVILDAMNEAANFGELKAPEALQYDIFSRAQDARIPVALENISVVRNGPYILIHVTYRESTDVFGYKYVYSFDKRIEKAVV